MSLTNLGILNQQSKIVTLHSFNFFTVVSFTKMIFLLALMEAASFLFAFFGKQKDIAYSRNMANRNACCFASNYFYVIGKVERGSRVICSFGSETSSE